MRSRGSPEELEHRRWLAIQRLVEGYAPEEVAEFLGVDVRSVRRWLSAFRSGGASAIAAHPVPGRPRKLTHTQEKIVERWLSERPTDYGFPTDLWTCTRLASLMLEEFGVSFHPGYLATWLRQRGFTPQLPRKVPRERDPVAIQRWVAQDWPRIKKKQRGWVRTSSS
jgi:transposase